MNIVEYIKERIPFLIINLVLFFIVAIFMYIANVPKSIIIIVFSIWFLPLVSYIVIELIKSKRYFDSINNVLENLDKKYLLPEVIDEANFIEGKILNNILKTLSKDMNERVKYFKDEQLEYRE